MLVCLRHPGRVLEADEVPPPVLLLHLARQLDVDAGAFATYARRDQTRRAHLAELTRWLGLRAFGRAAFRAMIAWALPLAPTMRDPEALATLLVEELRYRQILAPSIAVLELIVRAALRRAETVVQRARYRRTFRADRRSARKAGRGWARGELEPACLAADGFPVAGLAQLARPGRATALRT